MGRWWLAIAMIAGALLGPLSYLAGARLGALSLGDPMYVSLLAVAGVWAVAMPLLLWIWRRFVPNSTDAGM